ncbi:esterase [Embleya scabrispora]|uniref:Esterase n=1 Tax=Embleya scabrispora TaxID=159449 RepID=A0A1T3NLN7_9ACTN|nr:trypsin-like serine protease [Embleya scabrispora]OPC77746.1 esterase [Embleya scabrispora]
MSRTRHTDFARHRGHGLRAVVAAGLLAGTFAVNAVPAHAVTGPADSSGTHDYTARLDIGGATRGCSGVLIDSEWILTAASCFVDDPAQSLTVPAGKPQLRTTATIGRPDLTTSQGAVREIVELVPRTDRDLVLGRLSRPVTNVTPIAMASTTPGTGEELTFAGYGRTTTEWAPLQLHTGALAVDASTATTATYTGKDGAAVCLGDTGGPVVRTTNGPHQLVALNSRSYQGGCYNTDPAETRTGGIATRVDDLAPWVNSKMSAVPVADFDCDGVEDIAISDPRATVGGKAAAGLIRVVYGGGKGTAEITQDLGWVPGNAEPEDWFGEVLDTVDHNEDGCTDLVVGTPAEDLGSATDAGTVDVLYGARNGIGTGPATLHLEQGTGSGAIAAAASQSGDRMGHSVAAGRTAAGEPYLLIGVPGQSSGNLAKAGMVFYLRGTTNTSVTQDSSTVPGGNEANDGFGTSVAADGNHLAIGAPNEAINGQAGAGAVWIFDHKVNSDGIPTPLHGIDQDSDIIDGGSEAGDRFGASLSMADYRPAGAAAATESVLAIGSPGESLGVNNVDQPEAGRVVAVRITATGAFSQLDNFWQGTGDDAVAGAAERGDHFGDQVSVVNTAPRVQSTAATMRIAVGIPGEDINTATDAGAIQTFSLLGTPGDSDHWIQAGMVGIPGTPGTNQYLGHNMHFTSTGLYVGMPYGPSDYGALHVLPMGNATAGGTIGRTTTYQPGTGGLPATGDRFGHAAR